MGPLSDLCVVPSNTLSEEEPPHPPADALSIVEDVELVHKLVHGVAGFGDGAEVGHEPHVIALLEGKDQLSRGQRTVPCPAYRHDVQKPHLPSLGFILTS